MFKTDEIENYFNFMDDDMWLNWEKKTDFYYYPHYFTNPSFIIQLNSLL